MSHIINIEPHELREFSVEELDALIREVERLKAMLKHERGMRSESYRAFCDEFGASPAAYGKMLARHIIQETARKKAAQKSCLSGCHTQTLRTTRYRRRP